MTVEAGEWVAVMGPSGCGKSTLLHLVGGLNDPDDGSILLGDEDICGLNSAARAVLRRKRIGYVFQQYNLIPHLNVAANVDLPQRLIGRSRRESRKRTDDADKLDTTCIEQAAVPGLTFALP